MFQKGNPGRKKGTKNRKTVMVEEIAARLEVDPFEVLCLFTKGDFATLGLEKVTGDQMLRAAEEAASYLYSKKRSVELSTQDESGFKIQVIDYTTPKSKEEG